MIYTLNYGKSWKSMQLHNNSNFNDVVLKQGSRSESKGQGHMKIKTTVKILIMKLPKSQGKS